MDDNGALVVLRSFRLERGDTICVLCYAGMFF